MAILCICGVNRHCCSADLLGKADSQLHLEFASSAISPEDMQLLAESVGYFKEPKPEKD